MKKRIIFSALCFLLISGGLSAQKKSFTITVENKLNLDRIDSYVSLDASKIIKKHPGFNPANFLLKDGSRIIPFQIEQSVNKIKTICFVLNIKAGEKKTVTVQYGKNVKPEKFTARTYAELAVMKNGKFDGKRVHGTEYEIINDVKVPAGHIDHDGLYKYEGPGWESDKVGYRFYLDWRNATDIFGKKTEEMVLKNVGVKDTIADNNESFHTMQNWGMDIFKVGSSLGVGSMGMWDNGKVVMVSKTDSIRCRIVNNGPVASEISTLYYGWSVNGKKFNLESLLSIAAGSRLTKNSIKISGKPGNLVTGLAKYPGTNLLVGKYEKEWNYLALYGHQSLADDNLGIVIFYKKDNLIELTEDTISYIVKLKPVKGILQYYFGAAWEKEVNGIKNEDDFKVYLENTLVELNNPLVVEF